MARKLFYEHVDVFTKKLFGGNQLAVFPSPGKLTKQQMQNIAREINFSESTFIYPSRKKGIEARVRIFTPADEIPFAGHPTIGTAFVLLSRGRGKGKKPETLSIELDVGVIDLDVEYSGKSISMIRMHQPVPEFGSALQNRGQAARALGIKTYEVIGGGVVSNGLDFLIVEAQNPEVVKRAGLSMSEAMSVITRHKVCGIYLFARVESRKANVRSRFFAPGLNVPEDPATGSAAGALGGYLARILKFPATLRLAIEQGVEIGRPSMILVDVQCDRGIVHSVKVSGCTIHAGEGTIFLP